MKGHMQGPKGHMRNDRTYAAGTLRGICAIMGNMQGPEEPMDNDGTHAGF